MCAPLMLLASTALAQKFTGVIKQQVIEIYNETVMQMGGELSEEPTPEQEAYGFDPMKLIKMTPAEALQAANDIDGAYDETTNTFYVNDFAIRADLQTPMDMSNVVSYIVRRNQNTALVILHSERKYVELTAEAIDQGTNVNPSMNNSAGESAKPLKTGERATINEMECERYFSKESGWMREIWFSEQLSDLRPAFDLLYRQVVSGVGHASTTDDDDLWQSLPNGMPIIVKELTPGGSFVIEEIKSIERQAVDPKLFEVPSGYKKITLTDFMKMQMEMGDNQD